ncbi:MAG: hypothetical protein KME12_21295 [Trichocoleus desertorum ATA4-8-CV12]|nr:hypothetical protein [Trichocoleus desertorum ATA4-8-CV12]
MTPMECSYYSSNEITLELAASEGGLSKTLNLSELVSAPAPAEITLDVLGQNSDSSVASWSVMPNFESMDQAIAELRGEIRETLGDSELHQRRTIPKRFYITEAEEQQLEELRQGVNLSAFVRAKVFGSGIPRPRAIAPQINREAYVQLAQLRALCNQMAKAMNIAVQQNRDLPLTSAYLDQLERLETLLVEIGLQLSQRQDTH